MERITISNQQLNIAIVTLSFVLLGSAVAHQMQLDDGPQQYTESLLIHVEFISFIGVFILNFVNSICFFGHLFNKEWKKLLLVLAVSLGSIFIVGVAMVVDAPTLVYMT